MLVKSSTGNQKISCEFAIATLRNDATILCSTQREQRRTYSPMKNPTPLFAPVIAATLPEGAAKAAAAAEDDMLGARRSDGAFALDSAFVSHHESGRRACRVGEGLAFEGTPKFKTSRANAAATGQQVGHYFQARAARDTAIVLNLFSMSQQILHIAGWSTCKCLFCAS